MSAFLGALLKGAWLEIVKLFSFFSLGVMYEKNREAESKNEAYKKAKKAKHDFYNRYNSN